MKNDIEHIFKEKFDNFEAAPRASLFDAILAKRAAKKRRAAWLWSAAAVCTIGLGTWFLTSNIPETSPPFAYKKTESPTHSQKSEQNISEESEILLSEKIDPVIPIQDTKKHDLKINTIAGVIQSDAKTTIQKSPKTTDAAPLVRDINTTVKKDDQSTNIVNSDYADLFNKLAKEDQDVDRSKARLFLGDKKQEVASDYRLPTNKNTPIPEPKNIPQTEAHIPLPNPSNLDLSADTTASPLPVRKLVTLNRWNIEATAGVGAGKGIPRSSDPAYLELRSTTDNPRLSYAFDVRTIYRLNPTWNLQAGLSYVKRNEEFTFTSSDAWEYTSREEVRTRTIVHPVLGTIQEEYTVNVTDSALTAGKNLSSTNSYTSISIPVSVERMIILSPKWTMLTKGGFSAGITSQATGQIVVSSDANELSPLQAKKTGIHGIHLGIGVMYRASDRISLIAYPTGSMDLVSRINSDAIFEQRDMNIYTHIGFRVNL